MAIQEKDLAAAVRVYLRRAKKDNLPRYPLEERGLYKVIGGSTETSNYDVKQPYLQGRFIDAIAYAIQQPEFSGWYCSLDKPEHLANCNHGHVVKVEPLSIHKNKSLDVLLSNTF